MNKKEKFLYLILGITAAAALITTAFAAALVPERLWRPDTPGYLQPARALAENFTYPTTARPPGYPLLAAAVYVCNGGEKTLAFAGIIIAAAASVIIGFTAKMYSGDNRCGMIAALLAGLNISVIANAPLLLSDTLFFLFAALQLWWFVKFWKRSELPAGLLCAFTAAVGTLIRPINILFIIPLIILIFCQQNLSLKKKSLTAIASAVIFLTVITPWMFRNYTMGMPFAIDSNTGAMRHQNGAMLMAEINGTDFETEKQRLLQEESSMTFPDAGSRERWRIAEFRKMVKAHLFTYIKQHFDWRIFLPDAPTFLENFGITSANRGTMGVLKKSGVFAAVRHYFGENYLLIMLALFPLLLVVILLYAGTALKLTNDLVDFKTHWREIIIFLAFCEYYLFLPGAITAPRYQLPALPFMSTLAACALVGLWEKFQNYRKSKSKN